MEIYVVRYGKSSTESELIGVFNSLPMAERTISQSQRPLIAKNWFIDKTLVNGNTFTAINCFALSVFNK